MNAFSMTMLIVSSCFRAACGNIMLSCLGLYTYLYKREAKNFQKKNTFLAN